MFIKSRQFVCLKHEQTLHNENKKILIRFTLEDLASCFSRYNKLGGEVVVLVRNGVISNHLNNINTRSIESAFELLAVSLKADHCSIILFSIYRAPASNITVFIIKIG